MSDHFLSQFSKNIYLSNITWLMSERLVRLVVSALVGVLIARYLGPERFGMLSFAQSYVAMFLILAALGLDGVVVRELVNRPEEQAEILGSALALKILGSLVLWVCVGASMLVFGFSREDELLIAVLAIGVIFHSLSVIDFYFQSRVKSKYVAKVQLVQLTVASALKLFLILKSADLIWFAVVISIEKLLLALGLFVAYRQSGADSVRTWRFDFLTAKRMFNGSVPVIFYDFFVLAIMNSDQIMIRLLRSEAEVGWYAAAAMISSVWYFIPTAIGSTFNPYIIQNSDRKVSDENIRLIFSALFVLTVLGALIVFLIAPATIELLFGADYQPAAPVLAILILNGIFVSHVSVRTRVLLAMDKQKVTSGIMFFALVLNIIGNLLTVPSYGAVGAAWSSVVAWGASVIFLPLFFSDARAFVGVFAKPRLAGLKGLVESLRA